MIEIKYCVSNDVLIARTVFVGRHGGETDDSLEVRKGVAASLVSSEGVQRGHGVQPVHHDHHYPLVLAAATRGATSCGVTGDQPVTTSGD